MKPTVGDFVYCVGRDQLYHGATITKVHSDTVVDLHVNHWDGDPILEKNYPFEARSVSYDGNTHEPGTWHWLPPKS